MALADSLDQLKNFDAGDLDMSNIGSMPSAVKAIVMVFVFALVLGLGYSLYLTEKREMIAKSEKTHGTLREEYRDKFQKSANLVGYRKQKEEMVATFGALLRQLPSDTEVPGLIEDITRAALDNSLAIEAIKLQPEVRTEFYVELPIEVTVIGDYHMLGSFVSGTANLSRIVTLHDFDIFPGAGPRDLRMTIQAKTYRYLEES